VKEKKEEEEEENEEEQEEEENEEGENEATAFLRQEALSAEQVFDDFLTCGSTSWQSETREELVSSSTWLPLQVERKWLPNRYFVLRVKGVISGTSAETLSSLLWGFSERDWKQWSQSTLSWKILKSVDDNIRIIHQVIKFPWPLWNREVCRVWVRKQVENGYKLFSKSVEAWDNIDENEEEGNDLVRAKVVSVGYFFKNVRNEDDDEDQQDDENNNNNNNNGGEKCEVTKVFCFSPEGVIPFSIYQNYAEQEAVKSIVKLKQFTVEV